MPSALLPATYMATSAGKDALEARASSSLLGPWTLMTISVPPAVTILRAMALRGTISTASQTSSAANTSASKGNQENARYHCR